MLLFEELFKFFFENEFFLSLKMIGISSSEVFDDDSLVTTDKDS